MFKRADGIVDFDKSICIGCKACMAACPYDAIFINPEDHSAEKCNFCAHRIDVGLEPAVRRRLSHAGDFDRRPE
jgi:Fe-S-cluster-containing dehydrogenase component